MIDQQLVKRAQKGDDQAFFALMQEMKQQLYRIAFSFFKNEEAALEAIQEVTYRAYSKLGQLRQPEYFRTWLIRIMVNYCISEQKRIQRYVPQTIQDEAGVETDIDTRIGIEAVIARLEPRYQKIIILKYFEDMTISQIAHILQSPDGTVKTWLHKALQCLRAELGKGGDENDV